jgi:transcriptional regulator with XRE-family HTH domain
MMFLKKERGLIMSTGDRVKSLRQALSLSQDELGERIGIKKSAISLIENEKSNPTEQTIKSICREFGVSYEWLKNGEGPMMAPREYLDREKVDDVFDGDNEFVKQIFVKLADMPPEWWDMAEKALREALGIEKDR